MRALVTGGAGFIGSHVVDALLARGDDVVVLDDLFSGARENLHPQADLIEASVTDEPAVRDAVAGCEVVLHLAAHRAVFRSVEHPLTTDAANTHGTLTVLQCAREAGANRVVYASSSSVYGGAVELPTPETAPLLPRSPYAVTKVAGEHYCRVFTELFGLETVALRLFNVFGPRQRPDSAYAAVIPLFIAALRRGEEAEIHGDGQQSRSFCYVDDVVSAHLAALTAPATSCSGQAYNIAGDRSYGLLDLLEKLGRILEVEPRSRHTDPRPGDVRDSRGDIRAAERDLDWRPRVTFDEGLAHTVAWFG